METVLLYNLETLTMTDTLARQLDAVHAALMRAALNMPRSSASEHSANQHLYNRLSTVAASQTVRNRRIELVGHVLRSEARTPEPLHNTLLLSLPGPQRVGTARCKRYPNKLAEDVNAPEGSNLCSFLHDCADRRCL